MAHNQGFLETSPATFMCFSVKVQRRSVHWKPASCCVSVHWEPDEDQSWIFKNSSAYMKRPLNVCIGVRRCSHVWAAQQPLFALEKGHTGATSSQVQTEISTNNGRFLKVLAFGSSEFPLPLCFQHCALNVPFWVVVSFIKFDDSMLIINHRQIENFSAHSCNKFQ